MTPLLRSATFLLAFTMLGHAPERLRVVARGPVGDTNGTEPILVSFDRPVAGALDRSVDPTTIFRLEPAAAGRIEWRDPVTLRFTPAARLRAGATYTVTIDTAFAAMDGSRLARPDVWTFRVRGPVPVGGNPVHAVGDDRRFAYAFAEPQEPFVISWSLPVDSALVARLARIEIGPCGGPRVVRVHAVATTGIVLRRPGTVEHPVALVPDAPLPRSCTATLVLPAEVAEGRGRGEVRWPFSTHGPLKLLRATCSTGTVCPNGGVYLKFSTPVRGSEVQRKVKLIPAASFVVADTGEVSDEFELEAKLQPRTTHAVVVDTSLRDIFGQPITGNPAIGFATTGYAPDVAYVFGRVTTEREAGGGLAVSTINVDTLIVTLAPIPAAIEGNILSRSEWSPRTWWDTTRGKQVQRLGLPKAVDRTRVTMVRMPSGARSSGARAATLFAVTMHDRADTSRGRHAPIAIVQVTNLGIHAKVGEREGSVWITGLSDGLAKSGITVRIRDRMGRVVGSGVTDARGLVTMSPLAWPLVKRNGTDGDAIPGTEGSEGYVEAESGTDRAVLAISNYDDDLSAGRFGISEAWQVQRLPVAAAVFTERGIYRPGETVRTKAIVRRGPLGDLAAAAGDSVRWVFADRDGRSVRTETVALSPYGTSDRAFAVPADAGVGAWSVDVQWRRRGQWESVASASYRVAEYRPSEFLVSVTTTERPLAPGQRFRAAVEGRYLFGAPMGRAAFDWELRRELLDPWALQVPGLDGWRIGREPDAFDIEDRGPSILASGHDTLDATGRRVIGGEVSTTAPGVAARFTLVANVNDVNRQSVGALTSVVVPPAAFWLAARSTGSEWLWQAKRPETVEVLAASPRGDTLAGVVVEGRLVRHEWHRVQRTRRGIVEMVGEWVHDTVSRCRVITARAPQGCVVTPNAGGSYTLLFAATDSAGRRTETSFSRWASGDGFVPWDDASQFKMDIIADKPRYAPGDTATLLLAAPFTGAEAWVTIEREGMIEQRRMRLESGSTRLRLPITERHAPNVFVGVIITRGRSAAAGLPGDPGRPTMRAGYVELTVTPESKRLAVRLTTDRPEYRPRDSATVRAQVTDRAGRGAPSEVALWAVDEGVLALTGYTTPDPLDLLYRPRGIGMRLRSTLVAVSPQVPEGIKGQRSPGGGGGRADNDVMRSRFQTTAFFLGSVITDSNGVASARVALPDNLTTFRVMAVAVTAGDRFGGGDTPLLVTRPVIARPALPRFVRTGDRMRAGTVVNVRSGAAVAATVTARASGVTLGSDSVQRVTLEAGRGVDVRFDLRAPEGDSARLTFAVQSGEDRDAVRLAIPVKPDFQPTTTAGAFAVRNGETLRLPMMPGSDPARTMVTIEAGGSPLSTLRGAERLLTDYPYLCTEQATALLATRAALRRAERDGRDTLLPPGAMAAMRRTVALMQERQRTDGGIGYWDSGSWTSPWLTAYAGLALLEARAAGVPVNDSTLIRIGKYLQRELGRAQATPSAVSSFFVSTRERMGERVAAVEFLRRAGTPAPAAENELLRSAGLLSLEDRARLASVIATRAGGTAEATALLAPIWAIALVQGRTVALPDSAATHHYFDSPRVRPLARLLQATVAVQPRHPLVAPLVATLAQSGRGDAYVSTSDLGAVASALGAWTRAVPVGATASVQLRSGNDVVLTARGRAGASTTMARRALGTGDTLVLSVRADSGVTAFVTVAAREVPLAPPTRPLDRGLRVERSVERLRDGAPVTSVAVGELVRVIVRVTSTVERRFVMVNDPLPAGLEPVDLSLRTTVVTGVGRPINSASDTDGDDRDAFDTEDGTASGGWRTAWAIGRWDSGYWSPFEHREVRDDRVLFSATRFFAGTYTASYIARATTPGVFVRPPAQAETMYDAAVYGRSEGSAFTVTERAKP